MKTCILKSLLAAALLLAVAVSGAGYSDALLVLVNDKVITMAELLEETQAEEARMALEYSENELKNKIIAFRKYAIDQLIEKELIYAEFKELKAVVPVDYLQQRMNEIVKEAANGNLQRFEEALHNAGMTMKEFRGNLEKELAVQILKNEKVTRGNIISEREIEAYYEKEKKGMAVESGYRISVIQLMKHGRYEGKLDDTVAEIYGKLREGVPFEQLAMDYSEGANAIKGGDQGWMTKLNAQLTDVVKDMEAGQTASKPLDLGSSLYIIRLAGKREGGIPKLDGELREKIRKTLADIEGRRRYAEFIKELYMKYPVHRMDTAN